MVCTNEKKRENISLISLDCMYTIVSTCLLLTAGSKRAIFVEFTILNTQFRFKAENKTEKETSHSLITDR